MPDLPDLSQLLLDLLPRYGYLAIAGVAFAGAAGVPLPVTPLLLAAGALGADGKLSLPLAALAGLLAGMAGDCAGFGIGHLLGRRLLRRLGPKVGLSEERMDGAQGAVRRWGGWIVWLTRWLLTPLGSTVNVLAGANGYPFRSFVVLDAFGTAIFVGGYVALGRFLGDDAAGPAATAGKVGLGLLAAILVTGGIVGARTLLTRRRG